MAAKKSISTRSARDNYGIYTDHELMPNGEARFRLLAQEGGYIRTIASEAGKWQIAHKHKQLIETYVVESGWMGFADLVDDQLRIRVITVGGLVSVNLESLTMSIFLLARLSIRLSLATVWNATGIETIA
jgi:hypothetical protein